jgi:histidine ammonia-lyase
VVDTLSFVASVIERELNSSTDNPMVFTGDCHLSPSHARNRGNSSTEGPLDASDIKDMDAARREIQRLRRGVASGTLGIAPSFTNTLYKADSGFVISGGNFHGEYPSKMLDFLAIAVTEIANISERRIERLVNPQLSGLPAFLVPNGGLNSGFMIAHCTAAALASENKVLTHPSSVDTISTSAAKEDHVSMGGFAARKCLQVIANVETVVAIELLAACQALEFHRPLKTTSVLEAVHRLVRDAGVAALDEDRFMAPDINAVVELLRSGKLARTLEFLPK